MENIRVVSDGVLLDHVGEFAFGETQKIGELFESDRWGYDDAIAKLVQLLASGANIVASSKSNTNETETLKDQLFSAGRLRRAELFPGVSKETIQEEGLTWLSKNWDNIKKEIEKPNSRARESLFGHMGREFHYSWRGVGQKKWKSDDWYTKKNLAEEFVLDDNLVGQLCQQTKALAEQYKVNESDESFRSWILEAVVTHYRIFGEYWQLVGGEAGMEYMPARTRSSLEFLSQPKQGNEVTDIVMPFVGLKAIENVRKRRDLMQGVMDWNDKNQKVARNLNELQHAVRQKKGEEQRKTIEEIQKILNSYSFGYVIMVDLVKFMGSAAKGNIDPSQLERDCKSYSTYRWLWKIHNSNYERAWSDKIKELLGRG